MLQIIDAAGDYDLIAEAFPLMREQCRYTVYGLTRSRRVNFELGPGPRQWSLVFMKMDEAETHEQVIEWVRAGKLAPKALYDRVMPMAQAAEAMELLAARKANKIVLQM